MPRAKEPAFKVGDEVCIFRGFHNEASKIARVAAVNQSFIRLDDETRWMPHGRNTYPRQSGWSAPHILLATDEHRAEVERKAILTKLRYLKWEEQTLAVLRQVSAIVASGEGG